MSLLTQFYPGPGSGGSTVGAYTGSPTMIFGGWDGVTLTTVSNGTSANGVIFTPGVAGIGPNNFGDVGTLQTTTITVNNAVLNSLNLSGNTSLKSINLNSSAVLQVRVPTVSANLPLWTSIGGSGAISRFEIQGDASALASISTEIEIVPDGTANINLTGAALDASSVNHILTSMVNNNAEATGPTRSINLSGGTSAGVGALTTAGAAARAALIAAGWTVTLNP
jgi:hypothetical protein